MKKSIIILLSISIILVAAALGAGMYIYKNVLNINTIYKGVKIDGNSVENRTIDQALELIKEKKEPEIDEKYMNLLYGGKIYKIDLRQLGFSYEYDTAVKNAFQLGREGNFIKRLRDIRKIKAGVNIPLDSFYDEEKIENISKNISREINKDSVDAKIKLDKGKITVTDHIVGKKVSLDELVSIIEKNMYELRDIEIPVKDIEPQLTKEFLSRINGVIGEFSTSFKGSSAGRVENIRLSTQAISNKLILPGQEFSYNNTTGPRTQESGYKEANVIIGGELTPGLGGGVCQTSTTMYNALLLADLTILERSPHSIPASYVPYGQDAAVSYGYLDLKFRNDFDFPVYTYGKVVGNQVYIYIYGDTRAKNYQVKINPQIVETIPPKVEEIYDGKLSLGEKINVQKGRTGYKVNTYKTIIKDGKVMSKKQITTDHYRKKDYVYKIGPSIPVNSNN
ncbi:VanW family protein [Tissierella sp. MB52-C2]|uniref:VanW family protein n=1 Tax=Tissierella sp. MB52-C2 TaxID=3070999 RepID=UPI00280AB6A4|nr:VanW family protein [Tissierella sp. MB52-C2]WMM25763.1 VanW family protein [Tissierella sp. MB52-C2]